MIKKFVLLLCILTLFTIPVFASDWMDIGNNMYIDIMRLSKYSQIPGQNSVYSVWIKILKTKEMLSIKGDYVLVMYLVNCQTNEFAVKYFVEHSKEDRIVDSHTVENYKLNWSPIAPDSQAELWQFYACLGSNK